MARRLFFSFHYQDDIFRVNTVRNSDVTKKNVEYSGYWDHSLWEEAKKKSPDELRKLINDGLKGTSVSVTLAGSKTYLRPWVRYEIAKSFERGSGLLTVNISGIKDAKTQLTSTQGPDPLEYLYYSIDAGGKSASLHQYVDGAWKSYMTIATDSLSAAAKSAGKGRLSSLATKHDWLLNDGYSNFARWIEAAAKAAGR